MSAHQRRELPLASLAKSHARVVTDLDDTVSRSKAPFRGLPCIVSHNYVGRTRRSKRRLRGTTSPYHLVSDIDQEHNLVRLVPVTDIGVRVEPLPSNACGAP